MQSVEGSYTKLRQPRLETQSVYAHIPSSQFGQEVWLERITIQTSYNPVSEKIKLEPVYVMDTGELVYNSRMMVKGKEYHITWDNERFMLIKDDTGVQIYIFEIDDEQGS